MSGLGEELGNSDGRLWRMSNGYALATEEGLHEISARLSSAGEDDLDRLRGPLRVGLQWNTEVTDEGVGHTVSQAYCSALPVAYSGHRSELWEPFARLILEAAYEATLRAALVNTNEGGTERVFLTYLGGGVFGNRIEWILDAMERAIRLVRAHPLKVTIVNRGPARPEISELIERIVT